MNVKKRFLRAGVLAAVIGIAMAAPASAVDWDRIAHTTDPAPGAVLKFRKHGDVVEICDKQLDGYAAHLKVKDKHNVYRIKASGVRTCKRVRASTAPKYNLTENYTITFTLYLNSPSDAGAVTRKWPN